ncbi:MAG: hypothetical protein GY925_13165 [Actinomycetia bacterium]|nr:hypothetical protein [Actinomycetes bacterium]
MMFDRHNLIPFGLGLLLALAMMMVASGLGVSPLAGTAMVLLGALVPHVAFAAGQRSQR